MSLTTDKVGLAKHCQSYMKAKCPRTFSGLKLGLALAITLLVISSPIVMLVNPVLGAASTPPPQSTDPTSLSPPSTIG